MGTSADRKIMVLRKITGLAALAFVLPLVACSAATEDVASTVPMPEPSTSAQVYENPSEASDSIAKCKIKEQNPQRQSFTNVWTGFPRVSPGTESSGTVTWALIPIEFPDLPGESDFRPRVDGQMELLSEWFDSASGGKFKVEWRVLDSWATLPDKSKNYKIEQSANVDMAKNGEKLFRDAMNAADPLFDFSDIQTVNFILPSGQTIITESSQGFPWDSVVRQYESDEGKIDSYSIAGKFFDEPGRTYWSYWAHEFGHAMGLPHIGASRGVTPPFNPWDLMGGQDGPSRELSGWLRFLAGWLDDENVYCKESENIESLEMTLVPLSGNDSRFRLAVIPVSKTKAILIESRRETKFSCPTDPARNGALVYVYDATFGHNENFFVEVSPPGREVQYSSCQYAPGTPDLLLRAGDKVDVEGVAVEVIEHGEFDKIQISRN